LGAPRHPAGKVSKRCHPAAEKGEAAAVMARTLEQRLAEAQLRTAKLERALKKSLRSRDTRKKIVIAGAMLAEARDDDDFGQRIKSVARRRVTRPEDLDVIAEWLSTT
jgi:hypothetical protein